MKTKELQKLLIKKGFNPGKVDGHYGPKTEAALIAFKKSVGLRARAYLGPLTIAALRDGIKAAPSRVKMYNGRTREIPPWVRLAYGYLGLAEIKGKKHNQDIIGWWEALKLPFRDDETPWCAGFKNRMIQKAGLVIPKKYRAAALGWKWNGFGVRLSGPALGAVAIMPRPGKPGSGHTTFVVGRDRHGNIMGLGGNQGNKVAINPYNEEARNIEYYWPEGYPIPVQIGMRTLPIIDATGGVLVNEA
jgi:uncharacterized protein (TIGR02594 family)